MPAGSRLATARAAGPDGWPERLDCLGLLPCRGSRHGSENLYQDLVVQVLYSPRPWPLSTQISLHDSISAPVSGEKYAATLLTQYKYKNGTYCNCFALNGIGIVMTTPRYFAIVAEG